jgi:hypothetical protein
MIPRMKGSVLGLAAFVLTACSCGHGRSSDPASAPRAVAAPRPQPPTLLLEHLDENAFEVSYLAVHLEDEGLRVGRAATYPPVLGEDAHPLVVTAQSGGRLARVEREGTTSVVVVHGALGEPELGRVSLGVEYPAAMLRTETGLFIGIGTKVVYVDLERTPLRAETLVERPASHGKAYDVFTRAGDRVVAIDDVVRPIYADYFALAAHGKPRHLAGWDMPSLINGRYQHAALVRTGEDTHSLFVTAAYGVLDGNGHVIASIPVVGSALGVGDELLNSGGNLPWAVSEHQSRVNGEPSSLFDGDELTPLTGFAYAGERVLVAAGPRGLFVFPEALGASPVVVGSGSVYDVTVLEGRVFVLAASGLRTVLMELAFRPDGPAFTSSVVLDKRYGHFVD